MLESVKVRLRAQGQLPPEIERRILEFERICLAEIHCRWPSYRGARARWVSTKQGTRKVPSSPHGPSPTSNVRLPMMKAPTATNISSRSLRSEALGFLKIQS